VSLAPTLAADYTKPGVAVGTNALYDFAMTDQTINAIRIRVTAVSGSVLTLEITQYNPGGSVNNTHTGTYDVNTYQYAPWRFVAGNIAAGEAPYPSSGGWKFNSTVLNYLIAGRYWTANYINGTVMGVNFVAYMDKPTGILLMSRYRDSFGLTMNYTLNSYSVEPADYTNPGVGVGTNALYDFAMTNQTINAIRIRVTAVSGSVLTLEITQYNPGGSVNNTHTGTFDVNTYQYGPWLFVAANLAAGEEPYPSSGGWKFNSTVSDYHIAELYWTANYINGTAMGVNFAAYMDKPTGLLLMSRYRDSFGLTMNYTLNSYYVESGGIPLTLVLITGGAAALLVVVAAILHMRGRHK
jgi:hypothetical protein